MTLSELAVATAIVTVNLHAVDATDAADAGSHAAAAFCCNVPCMYAQHQASTYTGTVATLTPATPCRAGTAFIRQPLPGAASPPALQQVHASCPPAA
jgi:hypothetical protein